MEGSEAMAVANLFDYLHWRGDLPMADVPFNPVDGLILSWFAAMPMKNPVAATLGAEAARLAETAEGDGERFLRAIAGSRRFGEMALKRFEEKFSEQEQMQFAAMTVLTGDGRAFVAYRGTDATLVGWKENFNMAYADEVPAQREAARYLDQAASLGVPLCVGGHSKGGNLAVYAAARCGGGTQARLALVLNYDGPGLSAAVMDSIGYRAVEPRVETWLPEESIVGILLERSPRYRVVRSDAVGALQHSPYTWQVTCDGFETLGELSGLSLYADRTIRDWLDSMSLSERQAFVEALYDIVGATRARTLDEIAANWQRSGWQMLGALGDLDLGRRAMLFLSLGKLILAAARNLNAPRGAAGEPQT